MFVVEIWEKGYAHESGPRIMKFMDRVSFQAHANRVYGPAALVYSVREVPDVPIPIEKFSPEYIREMSNGG